MLVNSRIQEGTTQTFDFCFGNAGSGWDIAVWTSAKTNECIYLVNVLYKNFNLEASVQSAGSKDQYIIYIWKESMNDLSKIVSPYIIPEMKYKIWFDILLIPMLFVSVNLFQIPILMIFFHTL